MNRITLTLVALACFLAASSALAAEKIIVGATPFPHGAILKIAKPVLEKEGYELEIKNFSDYIQPNIALAEKNLDANFFQHIPYLEHMNKEKNLNLVWVAKVHIEPLGLYSKKIKNLDELAAGNMIAIPSDPTNRARALRLLEKHGIITLKEGELASSRDIAKNPKNLKFIELEAAQLPRTLQDVTASVINTNFASEAGLIPTRDAIIIEDKDSPYVNILVVRNEDKDSPKTQALVKAINSPEVKEYINTELVEKGILPAF